jgi:hypothetical protein
MTGNLDAFCERCGKTALPSVPVGAAGGGSRMLRRLGLGGRSAAADGADAAALRLCLGCRGYICADCWNDDAAVCQSCQPLAGLGVSVRTDVPDEEVPAGLEILDYEPRAEPDSMPLAWPASDLHREPGLAEEPVAAADQAELIELPAEFAAGAAPAEAEFEPQAEFEATPEDPAPVSADMADEPAATADLFEDRWAEILGRVQAVGTSSSVEPVAREWEPASQAEPEPDVAEEAAPIFEASAVEESAVEESAVEESVFEQSAVEFEPVIAVEEPAYEEPVAATTVDEAVAVTEEPVAAADEHVAAEEPVVGAEEPVAVAATEEPAFSAEELVAAEQLENELVAVTDGPATVVVEEPAPAAAEPAQDVADEPAISSADAEENLWAAVLHDADADVESEPSEPDSQELARLLQPRRVRRRVPKPQPRRPLRLPTQPEPATASPSINFAADSPPKPAANGASKSTAEPAPSLAARSLKLPPALPPPPSALTQPWPMPAPPAFLPPPPPAMSTIQPAPARFRPQNAPVEQPKPPSTRPCGNCGLELSAKVTFCRRCGTRQPLPA